MTQRVVLPPPTRPDDLSQPRAAVSTDESRALAGARERLSRAVREVAAELARARRDCREKQKRIDSLQAENARLLAGSAAVLRRDGSDPGVADVSDGASNLAARRLAHEHAIERLSSAVLVLRRGALHEHALERLSSAVLVLRRGNLALKEENAGLRLELARLRGQQTGPKLASAEVLSRRRRR